ncbi:MAG: hypothetical protein IJ397_08140 [Lachnospiraceae bacterium]|nr:hypothetical protein [Lachnospiraceae bacterium]
MDFEEIENKINESDDEISTEKKNKISYDTKRKIFKYILFSVLVFGILYVVWHYLSIWIESLIVY